MTGARCVLDLTLPKLEPLVVARTQVLVPIQHTEAREDIGTVQRASNDSIRPSEPKKAADRILFCAAVAVAISVAFVVVIAVVIAFVAVAACCAGLLSAVAVQ